MLALSVVCAQRWVVPATKNKVASICCAAIKKKVVYHA